MTVTPFQQALQIVSDAEKQLSEILQARVKLRFYAGRLKKDRSEELMFIKRCVLDAANYSEENVRIVSQERKLVRIRQLFYYICKKHASDIDEFQVGLQFDQHRCSVIHGIKTIQRCLDENDPAITYLYQESIKRLKSHAIETN